MSFRPREAPIDACTANEASSRLKTVLLTGLRHADASVGATRPAESQAASRRAAPIEVHAAGCPESTGGTSLVDALLEALASQRDFFAVPPKDLPKTLFIYTSDSEGHVQHLLLKRSMVNAAIDTHADPTKYRHIFTGDIGTIGMDCEVLERVTMFPDPGEVVVLGNRDLNHFRVAPVLYQEELGLSGVALSNALTYIMDYEETEWRGEYFSAIVTKRPFEPNHDKAKATEAYKDFATCVDRAKFFLTSAGEEPDKRALWHTMAFMAIADNAILATQLYAASTAGLVYHILNGDVKTYPNSKLDKAIPQGLFDTLWTGKTAADFWKEKLADLDTWWKKVKNEKVEDLEKSEHLKPDGDEGYQQHARVMKDICMPIWKAVVDMYVTLAGRKQSTLEYTAEDGEQVAVHASLSNVLPPSTGVNAGLKEENTALPREDPQPPDAREVRIGRKLVVIAARKAGKLVHDVLFNRQEETKRPAEEVVAAMVRLANLSGLPNPYKGNPVYGRGLASGLQWWPTKKEQELCDSLMHLDEQERILHCGHAPSAAGEIIQGEDGKVLVRTDTQYNAHEHNACVSLVNARLDDVLKKKAMHEPAKLSDDDKDVRFLSRLARCVALLSTAEKNRAKGYELQLKGVVRDDAGQHWRLAVLRTDIAFASYGYLLPETGPIVYARTDKTMPVVLNSCYVCARERLVSTTSMSTSSGAVFLPRGPSNVHACRFQFVEKTGLHDNLEPLLQDVDTTLRKALASGDPICTFNMSTDVLTPDVQPLNFVSPTRDCLIDRRTYSAELPTLTHPFIVKMTEVVYDGIEGAALLSLDKFETSFATDAEKVQGKLDQLMQSTQAALKELSKDPRLNTKENVSRVKDNHKTPFKLRYKVDPEALCKLAACHTFVKIGGKNQMNASDALLLEEHELDEAKKWVIDAGGRNACYIFDGDNLEDESPFSWLIKYVIEEGHVVLAIKTRTFDNSVSDGFAKWMPFAKGKNLYFAVVDKDKEEYSELADAFVFWGSELRQDEVDKKAKARAEESPEQDSRTTVNLKNKDYRYRVDRNGKKVLTQGAKEMNAKRKNKDDFTVHDSKGALGSITVVYRRRACLYD